MERDDPLGIIWYSRAAEQNYGPAQLRLAAMYKDGRGAPQDYEEAYFWLVLATLAMIGEENAEVDELHRGLLLLLSESRRAAVQDRALRWQPKVPAPAP